MIRRSVKRFSERSCSNNNLKRDDDSSQSHRALVVIPGIGWALRGLRPRRWRSTGARWWLRNGARRVGRGSALIGFERHAAIAGKLRQVRAQARHNAADIRDLIAAEPPHIRRAGHLLFVGSAILLRPRRASDDGRERAG